MMTEDDVFIAGIHSDELSVTVELDAFMDVRPV